ncbi:hypothetical protein TrRE_jg13160, partial [Triparma retinervis]
MHLSKLEVPDVADVETFTDFVDVLQIGILARLDATGDVNVKIISVGGVPVPETRPKPQVVRGLKLSFRSSSRSRKERGGAPQQPRGTFWSQQRSDNLVTAIDEGSVTTEIIAAATEKGGDCATAFESVSVDKTLSRYAVLPAEETYKHFILRSSGVSVPAPTELVSTCLIDPSLTQGRAIVMVDVRLIALVEVKLSLP